MWPIVVLGPAAPTIKSKGELRGAVFTGALSAPPRPTVAMRVSLVRPGVPGRAAHPPLGTAKVVDQALDLGRAIAGGRKLGEDW